MSWGWHSSPKKVYQTRNHHELFCVNTNSWSIEIYLTIFYLDTWVIRFLISFLLWEMVALYLRLLLNLAIYKFGRIIKPLAGAGVLPMPNWMQNKRINCLYMPASLSKLMLFVAILNVLIVVRTVILFMKKSHPERNNLLRLWVPTEIDFPSRQLWLKFHSFNKNALQHLNSILDVAEFLHPSLKIH